MSSGAALSPRRATHLFLLRQKKVGKEKASRSLGSFWGQSPNSPSLWLALRLRCSAQTEILETCLLRSLRTSKIFNPSAPPLLRSSAQPGRVEV